MTSRIAHCPSDQRSFFLCMVPYVSCLGPFPSRLARPAWCVQGRGISMASLLLLSVLSAPSPSPISLDYNTCSWSFSLLWAGPQHKGRFRGEKADQPACLPWLCAPSVEPVVPDMQCNVSWLSGMTSCQKFLCVRPMQIAGPWPQEKTFHLSTRKYFYNTCLPLDSLT